jgi:uncharacterized protein (TIGR02597 family)
VGLISAAIAYQASAQVNVYTDPVGFITLTAEGTSGPGSSPALSFWGLGMTPIVALRGVITSSTSNQIGIAGLTAGAFNPGPQGNLYYIEDIGSNNTAVIGVSDDVVANDANFVYTLANDGFAVGDQVKIYPHWTLASALGATDAAGLQPGSATTADQVLVQNPNTQLYATYYYATASKSIGAGWKKSGGGNTDYSQLPLYQDQGILISRQQSTNLSVQLVGAVKLGNSAIPLIGNASAPYLNFGANVYASSATTLGLSKLYTDGNSTDSFVAGSATTADQVLIHNDATGLYNTYYYATASKSIGAGWKQSGGGNVDASGTPIALGANILIKLQAGHDGFNWQSPAPY